MAHIDAGKPATHISQERKNRNALPPLLIRTRSMEELPIKCQKAGLDAPQHGPKYAKESKCEIGVESCILHKFPVICDDTGQYPRDIV